MGKGFTTRLRKLEQEITARQDNARSTGQYGTADLTGDDSACLDGPR